MSNREITAIILAAGFSSRMVDFKPLLPIGDSTFTGQLVTTFRHENTDIVLVGGHRREELFSSFPDSDVIQQTNPDYEEGMFSSVLKGLEKIPSGSKAFFINPVDIPLIRPATVRRLIETYHEKPGHIIYPVFLGHRGHPTLIPVSLIPDILNWAGDGGLKAVLHSREDIALNISVADRFVTFDVDTTDDYRRLLDSYRTYDIPSDEECQVILGELYNVRPDKVEHGHMVALVATRIGEQLAATGLQVDIPLINAAALLHDIAKGQPKHDEAGGRILRNLGFERVGDIVSVHTDLTGDSAELEAKIVYLADKLVQGSQIVSLEERYRVSAERYRDDPSIGLRVEQRKQRAKQTALEIEQLVKMSLDDIVATIKA